MPWCSVRHGPAMVGVCAPGSLRRGRRTTCTPGLTWSRLSRRCQDRTPAPSSGRMRLPGLSAWLATSRSAVTIRPQPGPAPRCAWLTASVNWLPTACMALSSRVSCANRAAPYTRTCSSAAGPPCGSTLPPKRSMRSATWGAGHVEVQRGQLPGVAHRTAGLRRPGNERMVLGVQPHRPGSRASSVAASVAQLRARSCNGAPAGRGSGRRRSLR